MISILNLKQNNMKRLLLLLLITASFAGCKKSEEEVKPILTVKPAKIELTFEKSAIKANGIEETTIYTKVTDANGGIMKEKCIITLNGIIFTNSTFKTTTHGDYTFQASIGTLFSNTVIIKASENLDGKAYKIELSTDKGGVKDFVSIIADNNDFVSFKTKVTDINGTIVNENPTLTLNGVQYNGTTFKTSVAGVYNFQASLGSVKSNIYAVSAKEIAEDYITIESSYIQSINSVGKVIATIKFKNISNKRLKYVGFKASCYNSVNDLMKEEITGRYSYTFNATGFWEANSSNIPSYEIGYYTGAKSVKIELYSVTLEDGKIIYAK